MASSTEPERFPLEDLERHSDSPSSMPSWRKLSAILGKSSATRFMSGSSRTNFLSIRSVLFWKSSGSSSRWVSSSQFNDPTTGGLLSDATVALALKSDQSLAEVIEDDFSNVSKALVLAICGEASESASVNKAAKWYIDFLARRCQEGWKNILVPVLETRQSATTGGATPRNICAAFRVFRTIALAIRNENDIALSDLVIAVYNQEKWLFVDDDMWLAQVMAFAIFGWLTMLYTPRPSPDPHSLQILGPEILYPPGFNPSVFSVRHKTQSKALACLQQGLQFVDRPLPCLLAKFGQVLPVMQNLGMNAGDISAVEEFIDVPNICLYTLHHVAKIKIQWVDCLSLHLEYDNQRKVLRVFRYPSLCLLMCYSDKSFLSRFFSDLDTSIDNAYEVRNHARDYFKEVLLSYRLIFAEARSSHTLFKSLKAEWAELVEENNDPLLDIICGQLWNSSDSRAIWDEIDACYPVHQYSTTETFKFMGTRLGLLQNAAGKHEPDGICTLWFDKRDTLRWWTFWIVLFVAAFAIPLGFLQIILQTLQLYFTVEPGK